MANNRMILLCNVCQPEDEGWKYHDKGVLTMAKWYPATGQEDGFYYNIQGDNIQQFLEEHQHLELPSEHYTAGAGQDNPVRLVYESKSLPLNKEVE